MPPGAGPHNPRSSQAHADLPTILTKHFRCDPDIDVTPDKTGTMRLPPKHRILLVISNPSVVPPLLLGQEIRAIYECIRLAGQSDALEIVPVFAATVHDLRRALLRDPFTIVHFIGHGQSGEHPLIFEDGSGGAYAPPIQAVAEQLAAYPQIECVLLNACYTVNQAETAAALGIPYVIAMDGPIEDLAAIEFTRGFYDAVAAGHAIESAFGEGCRTIKLTGNESAHCRPRLLQRPSYGYLFIMQPANPNEFETRTQLWRTAASLGRDECEIVIADHFKRVSHTHATVTVADGQFFIADLNSTYGTYLDGERIGGDPVPVHHGQVITLGGDEPAVKGVCTIRLSHHRYLPT
ncbi:MAG: FHA domain-containing protein [Caldilineaceae bacterium]